MAFVDRVVEYPNRFYLEDGNGVQTGPYTLVRDEGTVSVAGTLLNASNLNTLTQLDNNVVSALNSAGMSGGTYQNDMSDAFGFIIGGAFVVESGTDNGFVYRKWSDGRLDAERIWNIGQVTIGTAEGSAAMVSGTVTVATPSIMTSGTVEVALLGNSSNSAAYLERISTTQFRIAKNITSSVTLQGVTVSMRLVNGRWD